VAPPPSLKGQEIAGFRGGFMDALRARAKVALLLQTVLMPLGEIPEAIGQMFLGMALFRLGFFTLRWSTRAYLTMIAVGYFVAIPATAWTTWQIARSHFEPLALNRLEDWQQVTRPLIGLAHASVILLLVRAGSAPAVVNRLAAAGRMAFSNYLGTSLLMTALFYGWGFGLFAQIERIRLYAIVAAVWALMLLWSPWWLARFRYGPLEWAWRSLARGEIQALRKDSAAA